MTHKKIKFGKTGLLLAMLLWCFGMTAAAAPSVKGNTELEIKKDQTVSAKYTIEADDVIDTVKLVLSYDKDQVTYMSGSGGNNFAGNGGNGTVELSSKPGDKTASFEVIFRGKEDGTTELSVRSCVIESNGKELDALTGEEVGAGSVSEEGEEDEGKASFVIDERTFYVRRPDDIEGFTVEHMDIQGYDCRVLKSDTLDVYVVRLRSDNGSYRDDFVYNPETEQVIPFVQMKSGDDTVIFIEPEEEAPIRYTFVDLGWGPKYTIPAYKHYNLDGVDEIQDDSNRYLIYGINQDGEKAWYNFDYDHNSLQLFDEVAYQGEQDYILELETKEVGLREELSWQSQRYTQDMSRRLMLILVLTLLVIVLGNVAVFEYLHMRKLHLADPEEEEDAEAEEERRTSSLIVGDLEENETDFNDPGEEEDEIEIIDLDEEFDDED